MAIQGTVPHHGYGNPYIDSLISGYAWGQPDGMAGGQIRVAFAEGPIRSGGGDGVGEPWFDYELDAFVSILSSYEAVCNVDFFITGNYEDANILWYSVDSSVWSKDPPLADHGFPDGSLSQVFGRFNYETQEWSYLDPGGAGYTLILHEVLHGLGLDHPHLDPPATPDDPPDTPGHTHFPGVPDVDGASNIGENGQNQGIFTVMSYNDGWDFAGTARGGIGHAATPMAFDVAALQRMYGANTNYRTGDDYYHLGVDYDAIGNGWVCIWDAGGDDTISAYGMDTDAIIDLRAATLQRGDPKAGGNPSYYVIRDGDTIEVAASHGYTIANGVIIENAIGGNGNDVLRGNSVLNTLWGGDGHDWLDGEMDGHVDNLIGGNGDDTYSVAEYENVVEFDGGGTDTIETGSTVFYLQNNVENLRYFDNTDASLRFVGNELGNTIEGRAGRDTLLGQGGADRLEGGDGGDTMVGGSGDDTYVVGEGDTVIEDANGVFTPNPNGWEGYYEPAGVDTVETMLFEYRLDPNVENVTFTGPTAHTGYGNELDNIMRGARGGDTLFGERGNDTLKGGGGNDYMYGGADNDFYIVDSYGDVASEETYSPYGFSYDSGGIDEIFTDLPFFMLQDDYDSVIENLTYIGSETFYGIGNSLDNIIKGGYGGNDTIGDLLLGGEGGDQLYGYDGGDTLIGGTGADTMYGGKGTDTFVMDNGTEIGGDIAFGGEGFDVVTADESVAATGLRLVLFPSGTDYTLPDVNLVTSAAIDVEGVQGGTGNDWVDARRLGTDAFIAFLGNEGNDTFISGSSSYDRFDGGADTDTIVYSGPVSNYEIRHPLPSDGSFLDPSAIVIKDRTTGVIEVVGNVEIVQFGDGTSVKIADALLAAEPVATVPGQTLIGTADSDTFTGGEGNDRLEGGDGMDFLTGGAGADQLLGGAGTDFLYVDAEDTLIDGGDGFDYVYLDSSKSYGANFAVAGTNIECVSGTAADDVIDASGVAYGTVLFGNYGNDVLIGGAGSDGLMGSVGVDTLTGGAANDTFYFGGAWGEDTVTDFTRGQDVLDMTGVSGLTGISQLAITDTAEGASIAYGADSILLQGVTASSLTASDFHFV